MTIQVFSAAVLVGIAVAVAIVAIIHRRRQSVPISVARVTDERWKTCVWEAKRAFPPYSLVFLDKAPHLVVDYEEVGRVVLCGEAKGNKFRTAVWPWQLDGLSVITAEVVDKMSTLRKEVSMLAQSRRDELWPLEPIPFVEHQSQAKPLELFPSEDAARQWSSTVEKLHGGFVGIGPREHAGDGLSTYYVINKQTRAPVLVTKEELEKSGYITTGS